MVILLMYHSDVWLAHFHDCWHSTAVTYSIYICTVYTVYIQPAAFRAVVYVFITDMSSINRKIGFTYFVISSATFPSCFAGSFSLFFLQVPSLCFLQVPSRVLMVPLMFRWILPMFCLFLLVF